MSDFTNESVTAIETTLNDVDRALERLRLGTYRTLCSRTVPRTSISPKGFWNDKTR
jgi:hypothetical protein